MDIAITGAGGFIGSNLAKKLVSIGAKVTLVDSLIPEYGGSLFNIKGLEDRVNVNISDVRDPHSMRYIVQGKDYLFNLAGQTSHMERWYCTLRQKQARFVRETLSFSKSDAFHHMITKWYITEHNLLRKELLSSLT